MSDPLVSVVVPVFNKDFILDKTLESLLSQTFEDWNCILVNDGSTDKSLEIALHYAGRFPNKFIVHSQKNSGQSIARNEGIKRANGKFIAFLDGDDIWDKNKLTLQVKLLEDYPDAIMTLCAYSISQNLRPLRVVKHANVNQLLNGWVRFTGYGGALESVALIRSDSIEQLYFDPNLSTSAGLDVFIRATEIGRILLDPRVLMNYKKYPGQWHGDFKELRRNAFIVFNKHFPFLYKELVKDFERYERMVNLKSEIHVYDFITALRILKFSDLGFLSKKFLLYAQSVLRGLPKFKY